MLKSTEQLRPHPQNERIYGDSPDPEFVQSVQRKGILEPLLITWDDRIISGHRRLAAAREIGMAEVPVSIFASRDELDILEALIEANRQRKKTNEQIAREAETLMDIERERAKRRQQEAARKAGVASGASRRNESNVVEPVPPRSDDAGKTRDKVGATLGISGKTAERAVQVVKHIDSLEEEGKIEEAKTIKNTLNEKGIGAAHRIIATESKPAAESPPQVPPVSPSPSTDSDERKSLLAACRLFDEAKAALASLRAAMAQAAEAVGGEVLLGEMTRNHGKLTAQPIEDLSSLLYNARPQAVGCPHCPGDDASCRVCFGRGWLCRRVWRQLPESMRSQSSPLGRGDN